MASIRPRRNKGDGKWIRPRRNKVVASDTSQTEQGDGK